MELHTKILQAALDVFAETGYRGATTRRIAQEADVNEVTLFRHFGSKEELIREAVQFAGVQAEVLHLPAVPVHPERELTDWACVHYERLCQRRAVIRTCMGESGEHPDMAKCAAAGPRLASDELRQYLAALKEGGGAVTDFDPDVASAMLMSALFADAISRDIMTDLYRYTAAEAPAKYVKLLLQMVGVQAADNEKP